MATKTIVQRMCDVCQGADAVQVTYWVGSQSGATEYHVDLCSKHEAELTKVEEKYGVAIGPFIEVSTRVPRGYKKATKVTNVPSDANAIRAWAASNGVKVNERGRISKEVREAYEAAH